MFINQKRLDKVNKLDAVKLTFLTENVPKLDFGAEMTGMGVMSGAMRGIRGLRCDFIE